MKKYLSLIGPALLLAVVLLVSQTAHAADPQGSPQSNLRAFYTWYIELNSNLKYPLMNKDIYRFVTKETVKRLRNDYKHDKLPGGADYFLKVQDYDDKDWLAHIDAGTPVELEGVAVVPVTFGSMDKVSVIAFLRKEGGTWKIIKVDDVQGYQ